MIIQSVRRALDILQLFSATKTHLGISEISKALSLTNSTIHGLVRTLVESGFLRQNRENRKYSLGVKNYELSHYFLGSLKIYQVASGSAHRLAQKTGLTTRIGIWENGHIVIIINLFPRAETFQYDPIGPRIPAYCNSLGKAILASLPPVDLSSYLRQTHLIAYTVHTITDRGILVQDLEQTRLRGYSVDREETMLGIYCVGAPIFDESGEPVAAVSVSKGAELLDQEAFSSITNELIIVSKEISYSMGYQPKVGLFPRGGDSLGH